MNTRNVIFVCLCTAMLASGCAVSSKKGHQSSAPPALRQTSVLAIPSAMNEEMIRETGVPAIADSGIIASRNAAILGKGPIKVPTTLRAERTLRDTQWISSGRPYDNLRYSVRIKSRFAP